MRWRHYLSDPDLGRFVPIVRDGTRILVLRGYEAVVDELRRAEPGGDAAGQSERIGGGREGHALVRLRNGGAAVVRRYRRGGLIRHLNRGRYFFGHRAFAELRATERARAAGVRVPLVVCAAERCELIGYTAVLATRWIEGAAELATVLTTPGDHARTLEEVGRQVAAMHDAGVAHPDLNLRNLLVAGPGEVYVIDFDRARVYGGPVPERRRRRDLKRLGRSDRKLGGLIGPEGWAALRRGYGG